jgi:Heterokaryon incompatibility protein (HET)
MNHRECTWRGSDTQETQPTRILKIERIPSSEYFEIRLAEQGPAAGEPYVALSHRWGSLQALCTTTSNYQAHLNQIDFHSLPRSFQDAVLVTVKLGINGLWIDSLCILQDSIEDWERECPRMAWIYANAVRTVAACDAANGSVGFLKPYTNEMTCALSPSV